MDTPDDKNKLDFLKHRDLERRIDMQKKKDHRNLAGAENEKLDYFEKTFSKYLNEIETALNNVHNVSKSELPDYFNNISKQILTLQRFIANSNIFLKSYHIEKCQNHIQSLNMRLKELEDHLLPKKKFGFKNKKKAIVASPQIHVNGSGKDEIDTGIKLIKNDKEFCDFIDREGETIIMRQSEVCKKDVAVQKLKDCCVQIYGSPSTLHISHVRNCHIFCGPVSTSIFAENCENSVLVIACQQLRLHSSKNVTIYLHVTSRAIMEDCTDISLAPYNWNYEGLEKDFEVAGLDSRSNNWRCVDDFNWLNIEKPSPNWRVLEEGKRTTDWNEVIVKFK